jgi:hypothetical protein
MARPRGRRSDDKLRHGYGGTFEEAVENALPRSSGKGEDRPGRAEIVFSEVLITNPDVQYHVIVRFPTN